MDLDKSLDELIPARPKSDIRRGPRQGRERVAPIPYAVRPVLTYQPALTIFSAQHLAQQKIHGYMTPIRALHRVDEAAGGWV